LENNSGSPFAGYMLSLEKLTAGLEAEDFLKPVVLTGSEDEMQLFFLGWRESLLSVDKSRMAVDPESTSLRLPLVFDETLLGMLWVWS
jgi:hypothetical protein